MVVIGALADGRKQLLAVHDGFRESELSWTELLEDWKRRGLEVPPKLAVGDGSLGFWAAAEGVSHKTANVLDNCRAKPRARYTTFISMDHFAGLSR